MNSIATVAGRSASSFCTTSLRFSSCRTSLLVSTITWFSTRIIELTRFVLTQQSWWTHTRRPSEQRLDITKENMQVFQRVWQATAIKHGYKSTHWIERSHIKQFLIDVGAFKGSAAPAVAKGAFIHLSGQYFLALNIVNCQQIKSFITWCRICRIVYMNATLRHRDSLVRLGRRSKNILIPFESFTTRCLWVTNR